MHKNGSRSSDFFLDTVVGGHLCHVRYRGHESEMCLLTLTKSAFYSQKISFVELPYHLSMCCNRVNTVDRQVSTLLILYSTKCPDVSVNIFFTK